MTPSSRAREQAKSRPNGYVFETDGEFEVDETVPPKHITGVWKVDANGQIAGEFIPNPHYRKANGSKLPLDFFEELFKPRSRGSGGTER